MGAKATETPADAAKEGSGESEGFSDSVFRSRRRKKVKSEDLWWRISDDKVHQSKLAEVLSFQREVYLLFYELKSGSG